MRVFRGQCALFSSYVRGDERGAITFLILVLFLGILLLTGTALDLARHETARADLQAAVDRGVLSAASLRSSASTKEEVEAIVRHFVDTRSIESTAATLNVDAVKLAAEEREIDATARFDTLTSFIHMVGLPTLNVAGAARALERDPNIELSLVLDMSGSMCVPCTKLDSLKVAAKNFITEVVGPNSGNKISVNLIRYNWHVNVGPWMFERIAGAAPDPAYGACYQTRIEEDLEDHPGEVPNYPVTEARGQIRDANFINSSGTITGTVFTNVCPDDDFATIYLEGDQDVLKDAIDDMATNNGSTATYLAMQWGIALLNPDTQPLVAEMAMTPVDLVADHFDTRPASWGDPDTSKYLVLFTDGMLNVQGDFYTEFGETPPSQSEVEDIFQDQCQFAKDNGTVVFTIAFEAPSDAEDQMRSCATTPTGHFFKADTGNISAVFDLIARNIQALKLLN